MRRVLDTCDRCGADGEVSRVAVAILDGPHGRPIYRPEGTRPGHETGGRADLCAACLARGQNDLDRLIAAWRRAADAPAPVRSCQETSPPPLPSDPGSGEGERLRVEAAE